MEEILAGKGKREEGRRSYNFGEHGEEEDNSGFSLYKRGEERRGEMEREKKTPAVIIIFSSRNFS